MVTTVPDGQQAPTVAEVVGRNVRSIRGGHTADSLARAARSQGLKWSTGRISELEAGKVSPTLPTLFALAQALGEVTKNPVSLLDLVRADGYIRVNDHLVVRAIKIAESVSSAAVDLHVQDLQDGHKNVKVIARDILASLDALPDYLSAVDSTTMRRVAEHSGETEERIARSLGIHMLRMNAESAHLWGDSFSVERDRRCEAKANPQRRGRVSRALKRELEDSLLRGIGAYFGVQKTKQERERRSGND